MTTIRPMSTTGSPRSADDFTPTFVTAALRGAGHLPDGAVASVGTSPIGAGVGIVGQLVRLDLTYSGDANDADGSPMPSTLVAKFPSPYPETQDIAAFYGFYRTEVESYRAARSNSTSGGIGVRMPRVFVAEVSDDDRDTLLIIEDLGHLRMADQVAGASLADAEALMVSAAALHARWWRSSELSAASWLRPINNGAYKAGQQQYEAVWPMFVERYGDVVAMGSLPIGQRHGSEIADYYEWVAEHRPLTMAHTDYRLDNFFFDDAASGRDRVVVIDWQLCVRGLGAVDISYFVVQSLTTEMRHAHGEALVRLWHEQLLAGGVLDYSWNDALTDFRRGVLLQLPIGVVGPASMEPGNDRGRALMDAMAMRNFQALVDYDCATLHL
jgi:hypothetical protein